MSTADRRETSRPVTGPASEAIVYPVFDDVQRDRLRRYGTARRVRAGEALYSPADDSSDLLVVLSGEVVVSNDALGRSEELARHGPGQFAGELNMLTGQRPFLTARAATGGWVMALTPAQVREVLAREKRRCRHPAAGPDRPAAPACLRRRRWCGHRDHRQR
jgi:CRP-like cAMP-binding protein